MRTKTPDKTMDKVRAKARELAEDDRREAAGREARRRWEEVRANLIATADQLGDAAEDRWEDARDATVPRVTQLRKRATQAIDSDLEWLRRELGDVTADLRRSVVGIGADLKDAGRAEADRVIGAIQQSAAAAREEERKKRVRALVGFTAFGIAAGYVLARQLGGTQADEPPADAQPAPVAPVPAQSPTPHATVPDPLTDATQADADQTDADQTDAAKTGSAD